MKRTERRYLVGNYAAVVRALHEADLAYKTYHVHTVYLDTEPLTWSIGKSTKKYRIRWYNNNPSEMYFETKNKKGDLVTKLRRKLKAEKWFGMRTVAHVEYLRHEYATADGLLRVTIDVGLGSQQKFNPFIGAVVEIKAPAEMDTEWISRLLPEPEKEFSKSKWATNQWKRP